MKSKGHWWFAEVNSVVFMRLGAVSHTRTQIYLFILLFSKDWQISYQANKPTCLHNLLWAIFYHLFVRYIRNFILLYPASGPRQSGLQHSPNHAFNEPMLFPWQSTQQMVGKYTEQKDRKPYTHTPNIMLWRYLRVGMTPYISGCLWRFRIGSHGFNSCGVEDSVSQG